MKAMIYMNYTGNKELDDKAFAVLNRYCEKQEYDVVVAFGEGTDRTGISEPAKYMMLGFAAEEQVDIIVTMLDAMIAVNIEETIETLAKFLEYEVMFETVVDDLDDLYDIAFEKKCCTDCEENSDSESDEEDVMEEILHIFYEE